MHKKRSTRLFLTSIICHVDLTSRLRVFNMMIAELKKFIESAKSVELNEFVELREFRNSEKSARLYFNAFEYLINLFL